MQVSISPAIVMTIASSVLLVTGIVAAFLCIKKCDTLEKQKEPFSSYIYLAVVFVFFTIGNAIVLLNCVYQFFQLAFPDHPKG